MLAIDRPQPVPRAGDVTAHQVSTCDKRLLVRERHGLPRLERSERRLDAVDSGRRDEHQIDILGCCCRDEGADAAVPLRDDRARAEARREDREVVGVAP